MVSHDDPTDPAAQLVDERVTELAALLAAGILRLRRRCALPAADSGPNSAQSQQNQLDVCPHLRTHGQRG
jgi:hypothetical protein